MGHKIKEFNINKSEAVSLIFELQELIDGTIKDKGEGICWHLERMVNVPIDFKSIFNILGCDNFVFPVDGPEEYNQPDRWEGESLIKRVALCKQIKKLLQKTFNIKD